jgi:hypothetical protein
MTNKFIVIDTWNGEGYSSDNGTDIKIMNNIVDAERYAECMATSNLCYPSEDRLENEVIEINHYNDYVSFIYEVDDDAGSYQVHKLNDDAFAIVIRTNINEVDILTESEYNELVDSLKEEFKENDETEEDYFHYEEDGDLFVSAFDDYDFQFRLIKNI